jgi:DNA-binding CsgD family transcriptional regulator
VLTPHLRRAIIISNAFDRQSLVKSELVSALDALPCAIILTDEHGVAVHSNQNARRMLHDASVLALRQSVLHAVAVEAADRELHSALRLCVGEQNDVGRTGTAIRLTDITTPPIFAHILPLRRSDGRDWLHPRATAAVFVRTGNVRQQDIEGFAAAFALTSAETVVLSALLSGYSLTRAATSLGLARTTAKTHLEHIFQKTGVARQSELVKLAMQVFPPI